MTQDDDLPSLSDLLREANVKVSFSVWCRSGFVGGDLCACWRCSKARGEEPDEARAQREAEIMDAVYSDAVGMTRQGRLDQLVRGARESGLSMREAVAKSEKNDPWPEIG